MTRDEYKQKLLEFYETFVFLHAPQEIRKMGKSQAAENNSNHSRLRVLGLPRCHAVLCVSVLANIVITTHEGGSIILLFYSQCLSRLTIEVLTFCLSSVLQVESLSLTDFGCGDAACFPVHNWRILYIQMKARCIRYITTDFHVGRFSSVFENQLQSCSTDFGFLPPSSPLAETAEASGVILQLRHTCVPHSAMTQ